MQPNLVLNYPAILVAVLVSFFFSFLWWGPIFGRAWARGVGMDSEAQPEFSSMIKPMLLNLFGNLLVAYVMAHSANVWRGSVWGSTQADMPDYTYGFFGGFFTWLGFYVPLMLNQVAWEKRPWSVFAINIGGHFFSLQIIAQIVANWR